MTIKRYDEGVCGPSQMFESENGDWCKAEDVERLEAVAYVDERPLAATKPACKRCNDMKPEGFDVDRLRKLDEEYWAASSAAWPHCVACCGMSQQNIIDCVYQPLCKVPTDALMRELARRFL